MINTSFIFLCLFLLSFIVALSLIKVHWQPGPTAQPVIPGYSEITLLPDLGLVGVFHENPPKCKHLFSTKERLDFQLAQEPKLPPSPHT